MAVDTLSTLRRWSMLVIALFATLSANVFINGAAFLIPTLHTTMGLDLAKAGLVSAMPSFGMVFTLIAWGYVVDRVGERFVLAAGSALTAAAALAAASVHSLFLVGAFLLFAQADEKHEDGLAVVGIVLVLVAITLFSGLTIVSPGSTRVVQFFGRYVGTVRRAGLVLTVPLATRRNVSVRVRNFETNELKVNDQEGNPVNIAAIVVWQVADTAKAVFAVQDYGDFVRVQSESALRHVAMSHPYDHPDAGESSLRGATDVVSGEIATEVANRVGGIYSVLKSKAPVTTAEYGERYTLIGPLNKASAAVEVEELTPSSPAMRDTISSMQERGVEIVYGRWLIEGAPRVLLINTGTGYRWLDEWKGDLWNTSGIPSPSADHETNEAIVFGYLVAWFLGEVMS